MTSSALPLAHRRSRTARRVDPLMATLLVAAVLGFGALWIALAAAAPASRPAGAPPEALVVLAQGRPHAAPQRARAAARHGVTIPVARTRGGAATGPPFLPAPGCDRV